MQQEESKHCKLTLFSRHFSADKQKTKSAAVGEAETPADAV